ncbi:MAG: sulfate transporter CysZ [Planctomycetes bacterium]|nr:sulfate transporter CysZ [Planctomycetota bacterium]
MDSALRGALFFWRGFRLIGKKGVRLYALGPVLISLALFAAAVWFGQDWARDGIDRMVAWVPSWLGFLSGVLTVIYWIGVILIFGYGFVTVSSLLACPFNGLLAEAVERRVAGRSPPDSSFLRTLARTPIVLVQESKKILYYLFWCLPFLVLFITPAAPAAPALWFLFSAWMLALEFSDYPMDNHELSFRQMRKLLSGRKMMALGFGSMVLVCVATPILNVLVVPAGVSGATLMWIEVLSLDLRAQSL